jgi:hypothetical protein
MIAMNILWLLVAIATFFLLRGRRLVTRLLVSGAVFLLLSVASLLAILKWGEDQPLGGSVPLTKEALEQEGMTQEEWEEYKRSVTEEGTDPEDEK